jgi:hypothetical protein
MLGSMGTGEDLFYKCKAPPEEIVHPVQYSGNFSLKPRTANEGIIFLDDYAEYSLQYILIPAIVSCH